MTRSDTQCFQLLGLSGVETVSEVRRAYRQIARRLHPDRVGGNAEKFKEITAAYNHILRGLNQARKQTSKRERSSVRPAPWMNTSRRAARRTSKAGPRPASWKKEGPKARKRRYAEESEDSRHTDSRTDRQNYAFYDNHGCGAGEANTTEPSSDKSVETGAQSSCSEPQQEKSTKRRTERRSAKPSAPPLDPDIEAAWQEWCDKTRNFDDLIGRKRPARVVESENTIRQPEADSAPTRQGIRGWIRRGIDRLGLGGRPEQAGRDSHLRMQVSSHLVVHGGTQRIAVSRSVRCPSCGGGMNPECVCGGEGRVKVRDVITVKVAPGVAAGAQLRISGKGVESLNGGLDGDLILSLEPHAVPGFRRDGIHLHGVLELRSSFLQTGGMVDVHLPRGTVKLKVPARTRLGDRFRLRNQGLDEWRGDGRGDVYLIVREG